MNNLVEVMIPTPANSYEGEADRFLEQANHYVIEDHDMNKVAAEDLMEVKRRYKLIDEERRRITVPLDVAKKAAMDFFRPALYKYELAETAIKKAMGVFKVKQDQLAKEEEERRIDAARKEQARLEKLAAAAQAKGKTERADALMEQAAKVPATVVMPAPPPAPRGISHSMRWSYRIVDASKLPREYLMADEKKISGVVRSLKGETRIDGVDVFEVPVISAGRL